MFQQTIAGIVQGSQGRNFKELVTSCLQSRAERNEWVHAHFLVQVCLAFSTLQYHQIHSLSSDTFVSISCLWWNDTIHNGLGFPMLIKVMSSRHTTGQQHVQSSSLRMAPQMYLVLSNWHITITKTINLEQAIVGEIPWIFCIMYPICRYGNI